MADDHVVQIYELMERLSGEQRAEVLHKLLTWFRNDELAIKTIVGWAKQADLLRELDEAVTDAWAAQGDAPELWLPPGVALPEEAPGAGDLELEEMAGVDLSLQLEITLFGMYRHELVAQAEAADHRPGLGSRTLLTEPPALAWQELAVLGLIEIEDASRAGPAAMAGDAHPGRAAAGTPDCQAAACSPDGAGGRGPQRGSPELMPQIINSIGLLLDIFGVVLLFRYGLPADVTRSGASYLLLEGEDEAEKLKAQHYDRMGQLGLALLIAGFLFQLASNFLQLRPGP